ncbi:MAG: ATPase, T2SS/T4P/T4SS family [Planctomycetaceae bacterium]
MSATLKDQYLSQVAEQLAGVEENAVDIVNAMLSAAEAAGASDVHFIPDSTGSQVLWRIDGVLHKVTRLGASIGPQVVARLKVLAELLTYRSDVPQEGRVRHAVERGRAAARHPEPGVDVRQGTEVSPDSAVEMRLSTFPTLFGEKAVVR